MIAGTIVASNFLEMASIAGSTFREHHPGARFVILVIDDDAPTGVDGIELIGLADLDVATPELDVMKTIYEVREFCTSVKAAFLRYLLQRDAVACYLDPDVVVYAPFDDVVERAADAGIVVTPHVLEPLPRDGRDVSEQTLMVSGLFNLGFIAVGPTAAPFLDWWHERLVIDAVSDPEHGLFTDQRWVDWIAVLFAHEVCRDPGMNVAWWNLHERPLELRDGRPYVGDAPVRFVHFSGYDPGRPDRLSGWPTNPRAGFEPGSPIRILADAYADRLRRAGHSQRRTEPYRWDRSDDALALTDEFRRCWRDALLDELVAGGELGGGPPPAFGPRHRELRGWLTEIVGGTPAHPHRRIERIVWRRRDDLRQAFPDVDGADADRFRAWLDTEPDAQRTLERLAPWWTPAAPEAPAPSPVDGAVPEPVERGVEVDAADAATSPNRGRYAFDFERSPAHHNLLGLLAGLDERGLIVDLGCGSGIHAEALTALGFEYVGIEIDEVAIDDLRRRGFEATVHDLRDVDALPGVLDDVTDGRSVVALTALDVIEHVPEPYELLVAIRAWMIERGVPNLGLSVPNVAHQDVAAKLLAGRWDATSTGLLDHTHLRFFTADSLGRMLAAAGFVTVARDDVVVEVSDQRFPAQHPAVSDATPLGAFLRQVRRTFDRHATTYQFVGLQRPDPAVEPGPSFTWTETMGGRRLSVVAVPPVAADVRGLVVAAVAADHGIEVLLDGDDASACEAAGLRSEAIVVMAGGATLAEVADIARGSYVMVAAGGDRGAARAIGDLGAAVADAGGAIVRCAASGAVAFPRDALRGDVGRIPIDGAAGRALTELAPLCGVRDVRSPAAQGPAAAPTLAPPSWRDERDALHRRSAELETWAASIAADNEALNRELGSLPVRIVRRLERLVRPRRAR